VRQGPLHWLFENFAGWQFAQQLDLSEEELREFDDVLGGA